jgi:hypothetical protein
MQNLQTLQDYIFQALQHFAINFGNFSNFIKFFLAVPLWALCGVSFPSLYLY